MVRNPLTFYNTIMAKFRIRRKLYNDVQQEQQAVPASNTGAELRSAAIGTLAPMAITAGVNAIQNAPKRTKTALIGGALAAGLGYAANKGYLGSGAQKFTGNIINQGKNLLTRFKPQNQPQQTVQTQQAQPVANFDKFTGKVTKEGYKNYKNLDPEAQKRIQQQNAERKQRKAQQKTAAKQKAQQNVQVNTSSAPVQNQNRQQPQTVTLKRKTGNN